MYHTFSEKFSTLGRRTAKFLIFTTYAWTQILILCYPLWMCSCQYILRRLQCPRGIRRTSAAAHLLRLWVRIPPETSMSVVIVVLSGRGLCDGLIIRPDESYRLWWVVVCDLETSWMRRPWPTGGCCAKTKQNILQRWTKALSASWKIPLM